MILCQLSGGWDSVAAAILTLRETAHAKHPKPIAPVFFAYGQPYAEQERAAAMYATERLQDVYGIERVRPLHYQHVGTLARVQPGIGNKDYVPVRNLVLGAYSVNLALAFGCREIVVGSKTVHKRPNDPWSFSDCTKEFYHQLQVVANVAQETDEKIYVSTPLSGYYKEEVLQILRSAGIDERCLWSCYESKGTPCGTCYHCLDNQKAIDKVS